MRHLAISVLLDLQQNFREQFQPILSFSHLAHFLYVSNKRKIVNVLSSLQQNITLYLSENHPFSERCFRGRSKD